MLKLLFPLVLALCSQSFAAIPEYFSEKADLAPNICESCYPALVQWGGKPHCAPAAVANGLVWLSKNGYPSLQSFHSSNPDEDEARLVDLLGKVMGTTEHGGTSPRSALSGLKKYLDDHGFCSVGISSTQKLTPIESTMAIG